MYRPIVGSASLVGTLTFARALRESVPTLQAKVEILRAERDKICSEIYAEKVRLRDDYAKYYGAVQRFLATHPLAASQQFKLTFNVAIAEQGFLTGFLGFLNQRRAGSFSGVEEGAERVKQMLAVTNFDSPQEGAGFAGKILEAMSKDMREGRGEAKVDLREQLSNAATPVELYNFLYGLSYVNPIYNLKWDGKTLDQLSPGERGNLLLIFYLLIDREDIPLVIDQPEENLDNNTVYRTLVPCIREAKRRRQIFIVTHNPNLAVVCDADQVICAEIRKDQSHEIQYVCGSIENYLINQKIIDILEGTRPAFNKRDAKYLT